MPSAPLSTLFEIFPQQIQEQCAYPKVFNAEIPREHWSGGDFFRNVLNVFWLALTNREFPARLHEGKQTHPLYVISAASYGQRVCPCTSCFQYERPSWYAPGGVQLDNAPVKLDRDVYVLKRLARPLAHHENMPRALYMGSMAPHCLVRRD